MSQWFESGHAVDAILLLIVVEAALLTAYRHYTGGGIAVRALWANIASGVCLLLALRAALVGAHWVWIAFALGCALIAHLADLAGRWRGG